MVLEECTLEVVVTKNSRIKLKANKQKLKSIYQHFWNKSNETNPNPIIFDTKLSKP